MSSRTRSSTLKTDMVRFIHEIETDTLSNGAWDRLSKIDQATLLNAVRERVRLALLLFEQRASKGIHTFHRIIEVSGRPLQTCDRLEERGLLCHICSICEGPYRSDFRYEGTTPKCPKCRPNIQDPDSD